MNLVSSFRNFALIFLCFVPGATSQHNVRLPESDLALALGGGGFLSVTDMAGLTAGLLSVLMKEDPALVRSDNALFESGLFDRVGSISSISGGSWFAAKLAYSADFRKMIEFVAKSQAISSSNDPKGALQQVTNAYNGLYTKELLDISMRGEDTPWYKVVSSLLAPFKDDALITKLFNGMNGLAEQTKQSLGFLGLLKELNQDHFSWANVVEYVLSDIPSTMLIGDPVQDWAKDKQWRIIVSAITPNASENRFENPFLVQTANVLYDQWGFGEVRGDFMEYSIEPKPDAIMLPVGFSSILGCKECAAPYPYDSSGLMAQYSTNFKGKSNWETWTAKKGPKGMGATMTENSNFADTPIHGPVGASSAFIGALSVSKDLTRVFKGADVNPSIYFASNLSGKDAFDAPLQIIDDIWETNEPTEEKGMKLKEMGGHEITDGGGTDPHGIATAVATGSNDVFVVDVVENLMSWKCHFNGFPDPLKLGMGNVWHLFAEDQKEAKRQEESNIKAMHSLPGNNKKWAKNIFFGTIKGTTVKNKYFNIEAGRAVNVHVFYVEVAKGMSIGLNQDFNDYGELVAEISATFNLVENAPVVQSMIQMLKGSSGKGSSEEL